MDIDIKSGISSEGATMTKCLNSVMSVPLFLDFTLLTFVLRTIAILHVDVQANRYKCPCG